MKITISHINELQPKKLEIRKYQYVPPEDKTGKDQGYKWECFNKWKHLFEKPIFDITGIDFQDSKKIFKEIKIAQTQTENKRHIWLDDNGVIKGIK